MKNTTLLLQMHEIIKPKKPIFHLLTPILGIKCYHSNNLGKIINWNQYTKQTTKFNRILVLYSQHASNARRFVFINKHRSELVDLINKIGKSQKLYVIHLNLINQFIPIKYLLQHITDAMGNYQKTKIKEKTNLDIIKDRNEILFPRFNMQRWNIVKKQHFPHTKGINSLVFQQSYLNKIIYSLYMINFSFSPQLIYKDLKDFIAMINKFNFFRFFASIHETNYFMLRKNGERLIKSISWRTKQSEQYLLLLLRMHEWEIFLISVQDYCLTYQKIQQQQQQIKEQRNQTFFKK